jgi:hypothetical protein
MFWILILVPVVSTLAALLLYRQVGKRDFLKLDLVQFAYAFVFSPIAFIWMKSLLLYLAKNDTDLRLTQNQLFLVDTAFSLIFLYFFAFVVIHSLTKTFEVKLQRDPLFDILEHSEQFHLWISHTSMYLLSGAILTLLSLTNLFLPLNLELRRPEFYLLLLLGFILGVITYAGIWLSNFTARKFLRLVKLIFGSLFVVQVLAYFWIGPSFSGAYGLYWFIVMLFAAVVMSSQAIQRSTRGKNLLSRLNHKHEDGWSDQNFLLITDKLRDTEK